MSVLLPYIGVTICERAKALVREYPENIVGSFWIMAGYGFNTEKIPGWWIDIVLEENQAASIIRAFEQGAFQGRHQNPLYLGFCIIVVADKSNPADFSYVIQHLRMWEFEGIGLLRIMAEYNIPTITEVTYPEVFLRERYAREKDSDLDQFKKRGKLNLQTWSAQIWEDYCSFLMAEHGQNMLTNFYRKTNQVKDEVKLLVAARTKPLVLTEGEIDLIYIKTALDLLGEDEVLKSIDIDWVGKSTGKGKNINAGNGGLKNTRDVLISNPRFLTCKVLLLYDCDTKQSDEDCNELLKIRRIPQIKGRKVSKGIENLFPDHLVREEFYIWREKIGDYGEKKKFQEFQKMKFCKWLCEERRKPEDFIDFKVIIDFIKTCLGETSF